MQRCGIPWEKHLVDILAKIQSKQNLFEVTGHCGLIEILWHLDLFLSTDLSVWYFETDPTLSHTFATDTKALLLRRHGGRPDTLGRAFHILHFLVVPLLSTAYNFLIYYARHHHCVQKLHKESIRKIIREYFSSVFRMFRKIVHDYFTSCVSNKRRQT